MNIIRTIVSGKKIRTKEKNYNLDLTYITPRVIAMSFPGSGIEITYRNNIDEVSQFLQERHDNEFRVYNLSGISYNYAKLQNKVHDYPWEDHHSPPMDTLFRICEDIDQYLKEDLSNVVIIHCLAGKGRTGTVICCYLLYSGRFKRADQALEFYMKKRFRKGGGVTQPSQRRYVYYFHQILNQTADKIYPCVKYINRIEVDGIPKVSDHKSCRPFVEIYDVDSRSLLYSTREQYQQQKEYLEMNDPQLNKMTIIMKETSIINGDILFRMFDQTMFSVNLIGRFAFNTAFLTGNQADFDINQVDPDKIQKDPRFPSNFKIKVIMDDYCQCPITTPISERCTSCQPLLQKQSIVWNTIYEIMSKYEQRDLQTSQTLLFGYLELDDVSDTLFAKGNFIDFQINKSISNIDEDEVSD